MRREQFFFTITLAFIMAVGCLLRAANLGDSLWLDELHTDWTTQGSPSAVVGRAAQGNQSPIFFWLIWGVRQIADSEISLRAPSLIASSLLPLAYLILAAKSNPSVRLAPSAILLAAWLWATDDSAIFFGQEARPYAIVQLLALLQFAAGWQATTKPSAVARVTFWGLSLALLYLHYTAALLLIGELAAYCLWLLSEHVEPPAYRGRRLMLDTGIFLLLLTPTARHLEFIVGHRDDWQAFVTLPSAWELFRLYPAVAAAPFVIVLSRKNIGHVAAAVTFLVPLLLAAALTWQKLLPVFFPRYLAAVLSLGWLLLGLIPQQFQGARWRYVAMASIACLPFATSHQLRHFIRTGRTLAEHDEDWRGAAAFLRKRLADSQPGACLLVAPRLIEAERLSPNSSASFREYILFPVFGRYDFGVAPERTLPLSGPPLRFASANDREFARQQHNCWLLVRVPAEQTSLVVEQLVRELALANSPVEVDATHSFGSLQLLHVARTDN